jgi:hypothetical protein
MNQPTDNDRLLADALTDTAPAGFRDALLGETLRWARRRRRFRQTRRAAAMLVMLSALSFLVWLTVPRHPVVRPPPLISCKIISTEPLSASAIIATQPFSADRLVASVPTANVIRTTATSGEFREIDDDDLLALVAPRPAALIRFGPHSAELILVNPEDQKGFPVN